MTQSGHRAAKAEPNKTINDRALQLVVSNIIKLARRADLFALAIRWPVRNVHFSDRGDCSR